MMTEWLRYEASQLGGHREKRLLEIASELERLTLENRALKEGLHTNMALCRECNQFVGPVGMIDGKCEWCREDK